MAVSAASELQLSERGLRDEDAERVGQRILEQQQTLTSLDLRGNELTDAACDALAASIAVVPALRLVDLTDNAITNAGRLTLFRALANARRRCNVLLSGEGVRDILLAVKQAGSSVNSSQPSDVRATPERHEPPHATQTQRAPASGSLRLSPPRIERTDSPSALAEKAIADAERAMAWGSPFDHRMDSDAAARDRMGASRRRDADTFMDTGAAPTLSARASPSLSTALDEVCLQDRGLASVPSRLGEDRPGRVRPRKIDLSNNAIKSLSGLPQSVVQLKAANNLLRDWEGINTLPRLQRLDLSHNQLHQLGPFGICCAIRVLRLRGNCIGTLAGIEGAARTLIELDVSDNSLRGVDDIQPLTGCTRLMSVKLDGNPLLKDVACTVKSRAYRAILARLPKGCTLVEAATMPSGPLFTPSRPSNRNGLPQGSSVSNYSDRGRRQATRSSTSNPAGGGGSWPRRAAATFGREGSAIAVDLSAPSPSREREAHRLSSLVPPDEDVEPYKPAIRADNLHASSNGATGPSSRPTIFSTGGSGSRPTSPSQQRSRRHWSPSGRRNDANDAKVKAVAPRTSTNKHLSFRGKEQRRSGASSTAGHTWATTSTSASNLMTPTKSIELKYARSSPPRSERDRASGNDDNPLGRLAGHPGWPASPPPSAPQRFEENHRNRAEVGACAGQAGATAVTWTSVDASDLSAFMPKTATSTPRRRPRRSPSPSRVHGSPAASLSARGDRASGTGRTVQAETETNESETVMGLNAKITKLYNWHLAEMDLVQRQQMQLNQVTAELAETKAALSNQEKLLRLQLAADADGMPLGDISMSHSDLQMSPERIGSMGSMGVASDSPERSGGAPPTVTTDAGAVAIAAMEAAVAAVGAPALDAGASLLVSRPVAPVPLPPAGNANQHAQAETSRLCAFDASVSAPSPLPPEPTIGSVNLSGVPLSTPVRLHDLQEELSGTVEELSATRKALGHALTIMQSAGIADGKLKPLRQMLHQSGVISPTSPATGRASWDGGTE